MALQPCHECGQQVSSQASACPSCGAPIRQPNVYSDQLAEDSRLPPTQDSVAAPPATPATKTPVSFVPLIVFVLAIAVVGIGGAGMYFLVGGSGDRYRDNRSKDIQIDSMKIEQGDRISHVVGDAKNTSSNTLQQVEMHFHLFDSSGAKLGEAVEYTDEVGPYSTWSFRAACMFTNVHRAKLMEVIVR